MRLVVSKTIRPKRGCTCIITHPWSNLYDYLIELIIIRQESFILLFQGHKLLRLGVRYWWRSPNSWDTTGWSQAFGYSVGEPETWFLSGPPDDLTSIHKFRSKSRWVEGFPHISPSTGYYRSPNFLKNYKYSFII